MTQPVFRFAPSPNGRLHLGHAYSALLNAELARRFDGRLLLRIEDIDLARCRPDFEAAIYEDLAWLGIRWEVPVRRQSQHFEDYRAALNRLRAGDLVYPCFCTRGQIARAVRALEERTGKGWPRDPDGAPLYPGICKHLAAGAVARRLAGEPHAWRLNLDGALRRCPAPHRFTRFEPDGREVEEGAAPEAWGDPVIVRKDVPTTYHLSVVVDDALQGVSHVVRGADLEAATALHRMLQALLGLDPPRYHHHRLIRDGEGEKLSKSVGSRSLADLRRAGITAAEVRRALGFAAHPVQVV